MMTRWSNRLSSISQAATQPFNLWSARHTFHLIGRWSVLPGENPRFYFRVSGLNGDTQGIRAGAPQRSLAAIVTTVCSEVGQHCCFSNLFTRRTGKKAKRLLLDQLVCWSAEWHLSARSVVMVLALEVQLFASAGKVDPDNSSR